MTTMRKAALLAGMTAALIATEHPVPDDYRPKYRKSTPATIICFVKKSTHLKDSVDLE